MLLQHTDYAAVRSMAFADADPNVLYITFKILDTGNRICPFETGKQNLAIGTCEKLHLISQRISNLSLSSVTVMIHMAPTLGRKRESGDMIKK